MPDIIFSTIRDSSEDWVIECRFSDQQKFSAITVDKTISRSE